MLTRYLYVLRIVLMVTDQILINAAFIASFILFSQVNHSVFDTPYRNYLLLSNIIWILTTSVYRLYRKEIISNITSIYRASWKSIGLHFVLFSFYLVVTKDTTISRAFLIGFYSFSALEFLSSRFGGTVLELILTKHFKIARPVAILGKNPTGLKLAGFLSSSQNFQFEGFLEEEDHYFVTNEGSLRPAACREIAAASRRGIKDVYVSLTPDRMTEAKYLLEEAEKQCVRLKFVPDFESAITSPFTLQYIDQFPVITLRKEPLEDVQNRFRKRLFDIVFASLVIVFILSWLVPILAILIKLQSPGPVFFKQLRSGRDNQPFWCYKFRSMKVNNDSDQRQASRDDDRITAIGRFLRKTSLDELPQFFNVLIGNMSVVGPRPHMLKHTEQYAQIIDRYMVRQFLKPGITGWAQVNGYRGETEDPKLMDMRVQHDIWYMENWNSMLDVKIIFLTAINVLKGEENAY